MRGRGWLWPAGLVALLMLSAAANIAFMLVAAGDPSFAVEPDYYRKALRWDEAMAQAERNRALGWSIAATLGPTGGQGGHMRLLARLLDRDGAPLDGAIVHVEAFHNARAGQVLEASLAALDGAYGAAIPRARPGLWELRFRVTRGHAVFTQVVAVEVAGKS